VRQNRTIGARRGFLAASLVACALIGGCAARDYAGISLLPGAAPADLQALAMRARAGDNQAQLELGERYERGDGVVRNLARAGKLYFAAALDSAGTRMMFLPGRGGAISTTPVHSGALVPGLPAAKYAMKRIYRRRGTNFEDNK